jgi:1-acyl-sn-glycerol-3-phosphate acyltransferase
VKPQVYIDPRPAEFFDKYHERVRRGRPDSVYPAVRVLLTPPLALLYRVRAITAENVPTIGPAIVAPNHFSNLDHFLIAMYLRRQIQFMAKSQLFVRPIDWIMNHGGTFPVMRGKHDEEAFITAHTVLRRGGVVGMYGEGGRSRSKQLGKPKAGLGRLALESGVPVVPTAIHGSEHARDLRFPKVTIQYGEPIVFEKVSQPSHDQAEHASIQVFERIREMYEALRDKGRRGVVREVRERRRKGQVSGGPTYIPVARTAEHEPEPEKTRVA